jgi:hypothetical protein
MQRRVGRVVGAVALVGVVALAAGCGGSDSGSTTTSASSQAPGGELFTQNTHTGTLTPIAGQNDVFTLTFAQPSPDVTVFSDRPVRSASTEPVTDFVNSWAKRGFEQDPPNAALVLDQQPDNANTAIFELSDPKLAASGAVSYTAKHVTGRDSSLPSDDHIDPPPRFGDAHLFIDPSSSGQLHALSLQVQGESNGQRVSMNFTSPWQVTFGFGQQGVGSVSAGPGGTELIPNLARLTGNGLVEFAVSGGTGPITGSAVVPNGANATITVDGNPAQPLKNGSFSLGSS